MLRGITIRIATDNGKNTNGTQITVPNRNIIELDWSGLKENTPIYFKYRTGSSYNNRKYYITQSYTGPTIIASEGTINLTFTEQK